MKKQLIFAFFLTLSLGVFAQQKIDYLNPNQKIINLTGQELLKNYLTSPPSDSVQATALLDIIYAKGIASSTANANNIRDALSQNKSASEKSSLIRLLGQIRNSSEDQTTKKIAFQEIVNVLNSSKDAFLVAQAAMSYADSGYNLEISKSLEKAFSSGALSADEFYAALVKTMPTAPEKAQEEIAEKILTSNNDRSIDILSLFFTENNNLSFADPGFQKLVYKILKANEPNFPKEASAMGIFDAIRFDNWLKVYSQANEAVTGKPRNSFIEEKLLDPNTDSRKLVSYIVLFQNSDSKTSTKRLSNLQSKLSEAIMKRRALYPDDSITNEAARIIKK